MDSGFQISGAGSNTVTHQEFNSTTITAYDTSQFTLYNSSTNSHGTGVAGVALGNQGLGLSMGVAPSASLHIHQYNLTGSAASYANWWALGTDDAKSDGAVVQNNSWGFDDSQTLNAGQTAYHSNSHWAINDYVTYMIYVSTLGACCAMLPTKHFSRSSSSTRSLRDESMLP